MASVFTSGDPCRAVLPSGTSPLGLSPRLAYPMRRAYLGEDGLTSSNVNASLTKRA